MWMDKQMDRGKHNMSPNLQSHGQNKGQLLSFHRTSKEIVITLEIKTIPKINLLQQASNEIE